MMCKKVLYIGIIFAVTLTLPFEVVAQNPNFDIKILNVVATPKDDQLGLDVYFTVTRGNNEPLIGANIDMATIELLDQTDPSVEATVADPQTPFYVVLLLDASGSMQNVMPQLREAALASLENVPPTARFQVIPFSDLPRPKLPDFLADTPRVARMIEGVNAIPGGVTCLYDSIFYSIDQLEKAATTRQERKAVIAFTDGVDETQTGERCSVYEYDDVLTKARSQGNSLTPVHTIGLCSNASCRNINKRELQNLAFESGGFHASGEANQLGDLFRVIMDGLNAQKVASTDLYVCEGRHRAVLTVKLRDVAAPITMPFDFTSPECYERPAAPPGINIQSVDYDEAEDSYLIIVGVTNPQEAGLVSLKVLSEAGIDVWQRTSSDPQELIPFELSGAELTTNETYSIIAQVFDHDSREVLDEDGEAVIAERELVHNPREAPLPRVTIRSVTPDYQTDLLKIVLEVDNATEFDNQAFYYQFSLNKGGNELAQFDRELYQKQLNLAEALPDILKAATTEVEYLLYMDLSTNEGLKIPIEPFEFNASIPPQPTFWERWGLYIMGISGLGALFIVGWLVASALSKKSEATEFYDPKRPPMTDTYDVDILSQTSTSVSKERTLRIELLPLKDNPAIGQPMRVYHPPCTIGREDCDITIGLKAISREHCKIDKQNDQYFIQDLDSKNNTYLNEQVLSPHVPKALEPGITVVRLGKNVRLKIDIS